MKRRDGSNLKLVLYALIIVTILVISSTQLLSYTNFETDRGNELNVVEDEQGIINLYAEPSVKVGLPNQRIFRINNPLSQSQTVQISLSKNHEWFLENGGKERTFSLAPGQSETIRVNADVSIADGTEIPYTIETYTKNRNFTLVKDNTVTADNFWDIIISKDTFGDYQSIQNGFDAAISGDNVYIDDGMYYESASISTDARIQGDNINTTEIIAQDTYGLELLSAGVNASRLTIDGAGVQSGVYVDSGGQIDLNNLSTSNADYCIHLTGTSSLNLHKSTITDCIDGIRMEDSSSTTDVKYNYIGNNANGLHTLKKKVVVENMQSNEITTNNYGVLLDADSRTLMQYNNIRGNTNGVHLDKGNSGNRLLFENNYWGASNGPSGGVEDADTGAIANGDGDSITKQGGGGGGGPPGGGGGPPGGGGGGPVFEFDPWQSSAVPTSP